MKIFQHNIPASFMLMCFSMFLSASPAFAENATDAEIQYLLETIEGSGCTFVRNWSEYPAEEARSHMQMKLDYAKDKITKTEQFIKYIATKSSVTGKEYKIVCDGQEYSSAAWLTEKLQAYRNSKTSKQS